MNVIEEFNLPKLFSHERTSPQESFEVVQTLLDGFWGTDATSTNHVSTSDFDQIEKVAIGSILRVALGRFGNHVGMNAQDRFQIEVVNTDWFAFRIENQGCSYWAVNMMDEQEDRIVFESNDREEWFDTGYSVSNFFVGVALQEAVFAQRFGDNAPIDVDSFIPPVDLGLSLLRTAPHGVPYVGSRYFGIGDALIVDHASTWLWVIGRTQENVDLIRAALPLEWNGPFPPD